jgi:hypothetical protein
VWIPSGGNEAKTCGKDDYGSSCPAPEPERTAITFSENFVIDGLAQRKFPQHEAHGLPVLRNIILL